MRAQLHFGEPWDSLPQTWPDEDRHNPKAGCLPPAEQARYLFRQHEVRGQKVCRHQKDRDTSAPYLTREFFPPILTSADPFIVPYFKQALLLDHLEVLNEPLLPFLVLMMVADEDGRPTSHSNDIVAQRRLHA
ncbi:hypothetical protein WMF17_25535 [Sorangium sp. So ce362]